MWNALKPSSANLRIWQVGLLVVLFVLSNIFLTAIYARPLNLKSVALDSRIGGAIADSISSNATVKSFGAEAREEARIGEINEMWRRAASITAWPSTNSASGNVDPSSDSIIGVRPSTPMCRASASPGTAASRPMRFAGFHVIA